MSFENSRVNKKILTIGGGFIIGAGFFVAIATVFPWHKSVTISSKNWECVSTDTVGIEARCTGYRMVHGQLSPQ